MPQTALNNTRFIAIFLAIIVLGLALSSMTWVRGQRVDALTTSLVNGDVPAFDGLANLKIAVIGEQLALFQYYATLDRDSFREEYESRRGEIAEGLELLARAFPEDAVAADVSRRFRAIERRATELDRTLAGVEPDWDLARTLLNAIDQDAAEIRRQVDRLLEGLRRAVYARGEATRAGVTEITLWVIAFSIVTSLLLVLAGYSLRAYLAEARARRQLALFPERNPHPILSVARSGALRYANPGAVELAHGLGVAAGPAALLPPDLPERLKRLRESGAGLDRLEYERHGLVFDCQIHPLRDDDDDLFHVYLSDTTARKQAERRLIHFAYHDPVTGLPNRYRLEERLAEAIAAAAGASEGAVVLLGIDRFRLVIESYGRQTGDAVIEAAAERLRALLAERGPAALRPELFRMDGAQFALLLPRLPSTRELDALLDLIKQRGQHPIRIRSRDFFVSFSMGASIFPRHGNDAVTALKNADRALEHVRTLGGNDYLPYTDVLRVDALEFLDLESDLRHAQEHGQLQLFYQPQVDIRSRRTTGFEALLRWEHPQRGLILPQRFISVAEQSGQIVAIGEWVLRSACRQARAWLDAGADPSFTVAVNVSARQFATQDLPAVIGDALAESRLPAGILEIEITEGIALDDIERTIGMLDALKALGVGITIDDFGTGYSSLSYLKRLPVGALKIDRSFVHNMTEDENDASITRAIIALASSLKLRVVAEGVETERQRELLAQYGCDRIQGYLVAPPRPPAALAEFTRPRQARASR
jgi:diguanylate cyclase (GGDEF)-like protein